jgi:GNAT superfamily N-acetyltransferase
MPEIEIRPALDSDSALLEKLEHNYTSDHVWQMEIRKTPTEDVAVSVRIHFKQVHLPRSIQVEYPRAPGTLLQEWEKASAVLVAELARQPVGYAMLTYEPVSTSTRITDLVVDRLMRRQGFGTALQLAAMQWAEAMDSQSLILEMQTKNYPAIRFASKLGYSLCGFMDRYYANREAGIFFGKSLR